MRKYLFKNPLWFSWPYHEAIWRIKTSEKSLFLTFDDGPTPGITEWVIDQLSSFNAKATFFCLGKNASENPELLKRLHQEGHAVANHTFSHKNGWKCENHEYFEEVEHGQKCLESYNPEKFFRPPYGNIRFSQLRHLKRKGYKVVMWSHLSGDFDQDLNIAKSINSLKSAPSGSILVFHDSLGASKNLKELLPLVLEHFSNLGFQFKTLKNDSIS